MGSRRNSAWAPVSRGYSWNFSSSSLQSVAIPIAISWPPSGFNTSKNN